MLNLILENQEKYSRAWDLSRVFPAAVYLATTILDGQLTNDPVVRRICEIGKATAADRGDARIAARRFQYLYGMHDGHDVTSVWIGAGINLLPVVCQNLFIYLTGLASLSAYHARVREAFGRNETAPTTAILAEAAEGAPLPQGAYSGGHQNWDISTVFPDATYQATQSVGAMAKSDEFLASIMAGAGATEQDLEAAIQAAVKFQLVCGKHLSPDVRHAWEDAGFPALNAGAHFAIVYVIGHTLSLYYLKRVRGSMEQKLS